MLEDLQCYFSQQGSKSLPLRERPSLSPNRPPPRPVSVATTDRAQVVYESIQVAPSLPPPLHDEHVELMKDKLKAQAALAQHHTYTTAGPPPPIPKRTVRTPAIRLVLLSLKVHTSIGADIPQCSPTPLSPMRAGSLGKSRLRREWEVVADDELGAGYYNCLTRNRSTCLLHGHP
jgi:hypothetical protein